MRRVGDGEGNVVTSADAGCFMDLIYRVATSRGEIGSILLFSFIFVGLSFFSRSLDVGSRGTGNGAQVRDWMIDDGFRRIYGYFVLQLEKKRERFPNKHEILGCPSLRAFLNLRFANESAGNEQRLR